MMEKNWRTPPDPVPEERIVRTEQADVVVVGMGYSGSAAVRAAQENGARTIGIEAMEEARYNLFGRDIGHINSRFLASRGVPRTDPLDLYEEWMHRAGNRANPELVMKFCQKSGEAFDWYTDMYGIEGLKDLHVAFWPAGGEKLKEALKTGDNEINGFHFWYGTAEFPDPMGWKGSPTMPECAKANLYKAREEGAQLYFGMSGVSLLTDADGRITGVTAKDKEGNYYRFLASRGVILAAGDFAKNKEMVHELCSDVDDLMEEGAPLRSMGRGGSGVQMGVWAGGMLETRPLPTMGGNGIILSSMCDFGAVWLDQNGNRFCNEVFGGPELTGFSGNQKGIEEILVLFDEHVIENELQWAVPGHGGFDANVEGSVEALQSLLAYAKGGGQQPYQVKLMPPKGKQEAYYGRTPEELVHNAGLSEETAAQAVQTIRHYNGLCEGGRDTDFGRDPKVLDPLTGMLFLQRIRPQPAGQIMVTVGGLLTDGSQRVLGADHQPLGGLYATGNCCGRRFGSQYSTPIAGVSVGIAITLGREAGIEAARG